MQTSPDPNTNSITNTKSNSFSDADAITNAKSDSVANTESDAYPDAVSDAKPHADAIPNPNVASDGASSNGWWGDVHAWAGGWLRGPARCERVARAELAIGEQRNQRLRPRADVDGRDCGDGRRNSLGGAPQIGALS